MCVDQSLYTKQLLERFNMMDCKAAPTPAAVGAVLTKADAPSTDAEKGEMTSILTIPLRGGRPALTTLRWGLGLTSQRPWWL